MKRYVIALLAMAASVSVHAQKYMTRTGWVRFHSVTRVETIEAINNEAACVVNPATGEVVVQMMVRSFKFEKSLMQEHFNENYMESSKYPKATFSGNMGDAVRRVQGGSSVQAIAEGDLTMHGATRKVKVPITLMMQGDEMKAACTFTVKPKDYNIEIPALVAGKIAEEIAVEIKTVMTAID